MVSSCTLVADCRDYCTLDRRRFGLRIMGMLFALSASCVFSLRLHASLLGLTTVLSHCWAPAVWAPAVGLRPSATMADGWFPSVQSVSSAGLFNVSWSTTIALSFLELAEEDCFWHVYVFHPCYVASPAQLHLKQVGLSAGQAGSLEDFFVWHLVLPFDAKDGA